MKIRPEADDWTSDGRKILSSDNLEIIRKTLEDEGPIIVEHWHYRGGGSPHRFVFEDWENFVAYVQGNSRIGDDFHVWSFAASAKMKMKSRVVNFQMTMDVSRGKAHTRTTQDITNEFGESLYLLLLPKQYGR